MEAASELETIKWLLVAILVGIALIAVSAISITVIFWQGLEIVREQNAGNLFRTMAEDYLAKNENKKLIDHVEERLASHPNDVWAHWYMGQAKYHNGAYPESKRSFERVIELEQSWYSSVESWFKKIGEKLERGPQLVE
jgi:cytochrome c-type biogenesis protein CcmH/NrfG